MVSLPQRLQPLIFKVTAKVESKLLMYEFLGCQCKEEETLDIKYLGCFEVSF